mgnify:CR=1 FL=1
MPDPITRPRTARPPSPSPSLPELATLTVPSPDGPISYPDLQSRLDEHRSHGGQVASTWVATRDAGLLFASRPQVDSVEAWVRPDGVIGYAVLARFVRRGRGMTVPVAEIVGAARSGRSDDGQDG